VLGNQETPTAVIDPWIALTAISLRTTRLKIGPIVTPLPRHRPWLVARQLANLDHLSAGRVICTVGLGYQAQDFTRFGEAGEPNLRARQLDEGLDILTGLWAADHFSFSGKYYTLTDVTLYPKPVQSPRIPVWVAGGWPRRGPFRRAARWDGMCIKSVHHETRHWLTLDDFRACVAYVQAQRGDAGPFEIIMSGETPDDRQQAIEKAQSFEAAGATWWVEEGLGWSVDEFRGRIRAGPPRT